MPEKEPKKPSIGSIIAAVIFIALLVLYGESILDKVVIALSD